MFFTPMFAKLTNRLSQVSIEKSILALAVANVLIWLALPLTLESGLRLDVAEAMAFGPEFLLTYPKHPPLSFWLTAMAAKAGPFRYAIVFALGPLFATFAHYVLARFAARLFSPQAGLLVMLLGVASSFATYLTIQFNHNVALMPFWALTIVLAYAAFENNRLRDWIGLGLIVGLGVWAKYALALLCLPLLLAFLIVPQWRAHLKSFGPYLSFLVFVMITAPHFVAAFKQGGGTFSYAVRAYNDNFMLRVQSALLITYVTILANLLIMLILGWGIGFRALLANLGTIYQRATTGDRQAIFTSLAAFGPVLIIFYASFFGVRSRSLWITPISLGFIFFWAHVYWLALNAPQQTENNLKRLSSAAASIFALHIISYVLVRLVLPVQTDVRYPEIDAQRLTQLAQTYWREHNDRPLRHILILGNQRSLQAAGTIAFNSNRTIFIRYAQSLPFLHPNTIARFRRDGALVVAAKRPNDEINLNESLGPLTLTNMQSQAMPHTRGSDPQTQIIFGTAR
jgi:4-amino-4-deoxy-L-arabinose transferase-like glycosyltransferase